MQERYVRHKRAAHRVERNREDEQITAAHMKGKYLWFATGGRRDNIASKLDIERLKREQDAKYLSLPTNKLTTEWIKYGRRRGLIRTQLKAS